MLGWSPAVCGPFLNSERTVMTVVTVCALRRKTHEEDLWAASQRPKCSILRLPSLSWFRERRDDDISLQDKNYAHSHIEAWSFVRTRPNIF